MDDLLFLPVILFALIAWALLPTRPGPLDCEGDYARLRSDNTWECHDRLEDFH